MGLTWHMMSKFQVWGFQRMQNICNPVQRRPQLRRVDSLNFPGMFAYGYLMRVYAMQ